MSDQERPVSPHNQMHVFGLSQDSDGSGDNQVLDPAVDVTGEGEMGERGAEGEGQVGGEAREEEARTVHAPPIPNTPTLEEVRQHRLTHYPYRSWCPHCVRGSGNHFHTATLRPRRTIRSQQSAWIIAS